MAGEWLLSPQLAAAALMVLLSAALLWLHPRHGATRALVAFLLLRAGIIVVTAFAVAVDDTALEHAAAAMVVYYNLGLLGALVVFLMLHPARRRIARPRFAIPLVVAGFVALELALGADPCLAQCGGADGTAQSGPILPLAASARTLAPALAALLLAHEFPRAPGSHARVSQAIVITAFSIEAAVGSAAYLGGVARVGAVAEPTFTWAWVAQQMPLVTLAALAAVGAVLLRRAGGADTETINIASRVLTVVAFALVTSFLAAYLFPATQGSSRLVLAGLLGFWRLALPVLLAYAIARHRLLDLDIRSRKAVNGATLGAFFAGAFFVTSEATANMLGPVVGTYVGIGIAGVLLFAMTPLQGAAERLVRLVAGEPAELQRMTPDERVALYSEFAHRAWADGALHGEERAFLDKLRERLGITAEDAMATEADAARRAIDPRPPDVTT